MLLHDLLSGDWEDFQALVHKYFLLEAEDSSNQITEVNVDRTGAGPDDGVDLFLKMRIYDSIVRYERNWIVQCKHYKRLKKGDLGGDNIPSLIHEHGADGYLLVCSGSATSGVTKMFSRLNKNCRFKYSYQIWDGYYFLDNVVRYNSDLQGYLKDKLDE